MRAAIAIVLVLGAGCSSAPGEDAGTARDAARGDAGIDAGGGAIDAGELDAGGAELDAGGGETDAGADAGAPPVDSGPVDSGPVDSGPVDSGPVDSGPVDAGIDAGTDSGLDSGIDAGVPATMRYCVDIFVSNTCDMSVTPTEITIPRDQIAYFCWRNTSRDYPVDVWLSYGGGYTDLAPGATWNEPPGHCLGPTAHDEYADISTACSEHRFLIHCL